MARSRYESVALCAAVLIAGASPAAAETTVFGPGIRSTKPSNESLADMRGRMLSRVLVQVGDQVFSQTDPGFPSSAEVTGSVGTVNAATTFSGKASTGPASFTRSLTRACESNPYASCHSGITGGSFSNTIKVRRN